MNKKERVVLIAVAVAVVILLIGFYYGCRSGSEDPFEGSTTMAERPQALTASVS